jgi:hypothetical protein
MQHEIKIFHIKILWKLYIFHNSSISVYFCIRYTIFRSFLLLHSFFPYYVISKVFIIILLYFIIIFFLFFEGFCKLENVFSHLVYRWLFVLLNVENFIQLFKKKTFFGFFLLICLLEWKVVSFILVIEHLEHF